jgi:membrane-bound lytic murein transglycosylase MltF
MARRGSLGTRGLVLLAAALASLTCMAAGCGRSASDDAASPSSSSAGATGANSPDEAGQSPLPVPAYESALPEAILANIGDGFTGDFDAMVARRLVRVGVTFNRTFYFVDKGQQRGIAYEMGKAFEDELNKTRAIDKKVHVYFVPLPRDLLASALKNGKVDLVVAQVTVRPELQAVVDFSDPTRRNVSEVIVTGPGAPPIASLDDLAGQRVYARPNSSYHASLVALNGKLKASGKPPVEIAEVPANLEDDDLLEMANAGLTRIVVVDDYLAEFWKQIFTNLTVHESVVLRSGAELAVAFRKGSPQLARQLNSFIARFGLGNAYGNILEKRYLVSTDYTKQATSEAERKKFVATADLFRKYGQQYDIPYLLMAAQGYQESQLNQEARSRVGAVGMMQIMPATGRDMQVGDIRQVDANVHAGVKYVRFMLDRYYKDEPMDQLNKLLFTFASYNAGPGRLRQLRAEAQARGLDPNIWFGNVEQIASERIGRETVTYVSNIYKYYVAYELLAAERERSNATKAAFKASAR